MAPRSTRRAIRMLPSGAIMHTRTDLYHGLFRWQRGPEGDASVSRHDGGPSVIPCPATGRPLRVATIDACTPGICPRCASPGRGGYVSFEGDMRMAYACPECRQLVWLAGI
jgi:hypothetical protein